MQIPQPEQKHKQLFLNDRYEKIPAEWNIAQIKDISDVKGGKRVTLNEKLTHEKTQHPYIRVIDLKNNSINIRNLMFLSEEDYKKISHYTISSDDVHLSTGTIGLAGLIPNELNGAHLTENAAKLCKLKKIKKEFLSYFLNSSVSQEQIKSFIGTNTQCGTPNRNKPSYFNGHIPWIKTTEIKFNLTKDSEEHITQQALEESSAKVYPKGILLMAMYGQGVTRGKCAILGMDAAINQACAASQSSGKKHIQFIFYWCQRPYGNIRNKSQGTRQSNFNLEFVWAIKIPRPPLSEQKRIVIILSNVDSIIEKKQNYKTELANLKQGLMQKLLTGKIRVKV